MKLPREYDDDFLGYRASFGASYPDGTAIRTRVYSLVFPPPGFFPFYDTGYGDYHGFYWPIGREDRPPLSLSAATMSRRSFQKIRRSKRSIVANSQRATATLNTHIITGTWPRQPLASHRRNMISAI
jgi:hypothetical protein